MSINEQSNINLLIGILESEFNKQSIRHEKFVDFFNNKLKDYHERRFNYTNLEEMNKHMVSDCYQYISHQNREIEKDTIVLKTQSASHTFQTPSNNIKQQQFNDSNDGLFDTYKKQYDTLLNPKKPNKIDFSDTIEDQPIQNIGSIVNQTLEDRQKELERITNTYSETPPDWANPPIQDNNTFKETQPMKLVIEDSVPTKITPQPKISNSILKTAQPSSFKKVTFDMKSSTDTKFQDKSQVNTVDKLLSKLKSKPQDTSNQSLSNMKHSMPELEKRIYDKIEANVEAKFAILNEKYQQLQVKYEELSMKYGELIIPHGTQERLLN